MLPEALNFACSGHPFWWSHSTSGSGNEAASEREGVGMSLYLITNLLYFTYEHSNSLPDKAGCHPSAHRRLHTPDYVPNCDCWQGNRK